MPPRTPQPPPALVTARFTFRRLTMDDAANLAALDSDPEVMRYLSGGAPTPLATVRARVIPAFLALDTAAGFGCWCAWSRASGAFTGWVSLRPGPSVAAGGELGYRIRREAWGRGIATELGRAVLARAFAEMALPRVFATTYEENLGSRRVLEKLGMTLARRYRPSPEELAGSATHEPDDGEPWPGDDLEYAISREEWQRLR